MQKKSVNVWKENLSKEMNTKEVQFILVRDFFIRIKERV